MIWYLLMCSGSFGALTCTAPAKVDSQAICNFLVAHYNTMGFNPADRKRYVNAKCVGVRSDMPPPRAPAPNPPSIVR